MANLDRQLRELVERACSQPPETSWDSLSQELAIAIPTLSAFYQRKCLPKLHNFCESEGYV